MERKDRYLLTITLALGLTEVGAIAANQKGKTPSIFNSQTPTTFVPSPTFFNPTEEILVSPTVLPSSTEFPTLTPTSISSPSPEIPFGEHPCVLPFKNYTHLTTLFLQEHYGGLIHLGLDFGAKPEQEGEDIVSPCDGTIIFTGAVVGGKQNLGNVVVIEFPDEIEGKVYGVFGHLKDVVEREPGEKVLAGDKIGTLGHSGGWLNTHLHFQIWNELGWKIYIEGRAIWYPDMSQRVGYYGLEHSRKEEIAKYLIDPQEWLERRIGQKIKP